MADSDPPPSSFKLPNVGGIDNNEDALKGLDPAPGPLDICPCCKEGMSKVAGNLYRCERNSHAFRLHPNGEDGWYLVKVEGPANGFGRPCPDRKRWDSGPSGGWIESHLAATDDDLLGPEM